MENSKFKFIDDSVKPQGDPAVLAKGVGDIGLTLETARLLKEGGIATVEDLCKCQMRHIYRIKGIGKKHVFEVLRKMQALGVDFVRVQKPESENKQNIDNAESKDIAQKETKQQNRDSKAEKRNRKNKQNRNQPNNERANAQPVQNQNANKPQVERVEKLNKKDKKQNNNQDRENQRFNQKDRRQDKRERQERHQDEPRRVKVNSYEVEMTPSFNIEKTNNIKEERSRKVAKLISNLPPIKNADGLYKFYRHGKWGYKDTQGKIVIEPTYSEAFEFREGMACVELDEKCGFINKQGELVIPIQYDTACSFSEGLASVTKNDKCGYIDKNGEIVFDFEYEAATSFVDDIALVKKDGKWGYMDRHTGEIRLR